MNVKKLKSNLKQRLDSRYNIETIGPTQGYWFKKPSNFRRMVNKESDIRFDNNYKGCKDKFYDKIDYYEELAMKNIDIDIKYAEPVNNIYQNESDEYYLK
jgi:hypothetical protein